MEASPRTRLLVVRPATLVLTALLVACTGKESALTDEPRPSASSAPSKPFVRRCDTSVYGNLGRGWRRHALIVGPASFVGMGVLDSVSSPSAEPLDGGPQKVLAVVETGPPVSVTITPSSEVTLLYNPATFNRVHKVSEGDASVRFVPCAATRSPFPQAQRGETQFNGGFFVAGPVCATVEVSVKGVTPVSARLPLLGGNCL